MRQKTGFAMPKRKAKQRPKPVRGRVPEFKTREFRVRTALLIVALSAFVAYCPILAGYVPFPADTVLAFAPWATHARTCCTGTSHAELGDIATQFYPWRTKLNAKLRNFEIPL